MLFEKDLVFTVWLIYQPTKHVFEGLLQLPSFGCSFMAKHLWNDLFGNGTFYTTNLLEVFYPYCFMKKIQSFRKSGFKSSLFLFYVFHSNIAVWQHYLFSFRWVRMPNLKLQIVKNNMAQFFLFFLPFSGIAPCVGTAGTVHDTYT